MIITYFYSFILLFIQAIDINDKNWIIKEEKEGGMNYTFYKLLMNKNNYKWNENV